MPKHFSCATRQTWIIKFIILKEKKPTKNKTHIKHPKPCLPEYLFFKHHLDKSDCHLLRGLSFLIICCFKRSYISSSYCLLSLESAWLLKIMFKTFYLFCCDILFSSSLCQGLFCSYPELFQSLWYKTTTVLLCAFILWVRNSDQKLWRWLISAFTCLGLGWEGSNDWAWLQ